GRLWAYVVPFDRNLALMQIKMKYEVMVLGPAQVPYIWAFSNKSYMQLTQLDFRVLYYCLLIIVASSFHVFMLISGVYIGLLIKNHDWPNLVFLDRSLCGFHHL
ncbi:hypothetical protein ACJX0J_007652, partial [Zea mays]